MAEEKTKLEREYIIPLRKEWLKTPMHKRSKKAIRAVRMFLARHMKTDIENVRVGRFLNEQIWTRGIRNPPHKIKVKVSKEEDIVRAELAELSGAQKKILDEETKIQEETKKEKEKRLKEEEAKRKEEEEKVKKEVEKAKKDIETKIKEEKAKELKKPDVKEEKEVAIHDKAIEKTHISGNKDMPQHQAQHTMKRQHSE